jgi:hypothetical protein
VSTYALKVCTTCLMVLANDEGDPDWTEAQEQEHRAEMARRLAGLHVTLGDGDDDDVFSRAQCHACGTTLGGSRHAATGWPVEVAP